MAKIDRFPSRASALAEDEPLDPFYRPAAAPRLRPERPLPIEDRAAVDDDEEAFLRSRRRVPVRRGLLPANRFVRIAIFCGLLAALGLLAWLGYAVDRFLRNDPRFRIDSSDAIQVMGNSEVKRAELLSVFGSDIGRNVFFIPLAERRAALERLPWVERATVMRLLPNQLRVAVVERTPVAFVRRGNRIGLVDAHGVLLDMPPAMIAARHYSFPVVTGLDASTPLAARAARMQMYERFVADLDSGGERVSSQLSEVDLSDGEDVKALMPEQGSDVLAHFGDEKFLARYRNYKAHLAEWRQQYPRLSSVDLRYDQQVVLQMAQGSEESSKTAVSKEAVSKEAGSKEAGSKPAVSKTAVSKPAGSKAAGNRHPAIKTGKHPPAKAAKRPAAARAGVSR